MKAKLFTAFAAIAISLSAFATVPQDCNLDTCGGGGAKCCTDTAGNTWYMTVIIEN